MPLVVESFAAGGRNPSRVEATRVVVKDDHGNPLALVVEYGPGLFIVAHQNDGDFDVLLRTLGCEAAAVLRTHHVGD